MNDSSELSIRDSRTPWRFGRFAGRGGRPKLLFGRMFEDAAIERCVFRTGMRSFCIASAGCTALELARSGVPVVAVDINPTQIAYVERRLQGGAIERGAADRLMALVRKAVCCCGVRREEIITFLEMQDLQAQLEFWRAHFDRPALRQATKLFFSRHALRSAYASSFVRALPDSFADVLWSRLVRGIAIHPNRTNPYIWRLFLGVEPKGWSEPAVAGLAIELASADAADYLANCPAGIFHGFTLSNILDGADAAYAARLCRSLRRAGAAKATVVLRSIAEPHCQEEDEMAAADRSLLWGRIVIRSIENIESAL